MLREWLSWAELIVVAKGWWRQKRVVEWERERGWTGKNIGGWGFVLLGLVKRERKRKRKAGG